MKWVFVFMLNVKIVSPIKVIFKGEATSIILPGDTGVFELMSYHKSMMSRLLKGDIDVDGRLFPVARGIVKISKNNVTIIVEEE